MGKGFGDELERSGEGGGGTWKLYSLKFSTLFSILPTATLRCQCDVSEIEALFIQGKWFVIFQLLNKCLWLTKCFAMPGVTVHDNLCRMHMHGWMDGYAPGDWGDLGGPKLELICEEAVLHSSLCRMKRQKVLVRTCSTLREQPPYSLWGCHQNNKSTN